MRIGETTATEVAATTADARGGYRFETDCGIVEGTVYKARTPDVPLPAVAVKLLRDESCSTKYFVMVTDPYWGLRIQPYPAKEPPFTEDFVMGYRLEVQVKQEGVPLNGEGVSLQVEWTTLEDGTCAGLLPGDTHQELVYDSELETYVEGPTTLHRITTVRDVVKDEDGWGKFRLYDGTFEDVILPKGHGAPFQRLDDRRDDSPQTQQAMPQRAVGRITALYKGRRREVAEGEPAVFDIAPATVEVTLPSNISGTLRAELLGYHGARYGQNGAPGQTLTFEDVRPGDYAVKCYRLNADWTYDGTVGSPRVKISVDEGETVQVTAPDFLQGGKGIWVYKYGAEPLAGATVYTASAQAMGTTDENGYWDGTGKNGDRVNDPVWGFQVTDEVGPLSGYGEIVLGGCISQADVYAWRKGLRYYPNIKYVIGAVRVYAQDDSLSDIVRQSEPLPAGGWITEAGLPKYTQAQVITIPTQPPTYAFDTTNLQRILWVVDFGGGDLYPQAQEIVDLVYFGEQPSFDSWANKSGPTPLPDPKLLGGKIKGNIVRRSRELLCGTDAALKNIEFGKHAWYLEHRALPAGQGGTAAVCFSDLQCPYCGAPAFTDPADGQLRGYCRQCTNLWGAPMGDCRTYFETMPLAASGG